MVLALTLVVGGLTRSAWAGPDCMKMKRDGYGKGMGKEGPMKMLEKLDLTEQQQSQVEDIMTKHKDEKQNLRETIKTAKKALGDAIHADPFDEQAVRLASQTMSTAMEDMAVLRGKIFSQMRSVLTPEQIDQFKEMHIRRDERMKCKAKFQKMMGQ